MIIQMRGSSNTNGLLDLINRLPSDIIMAEIGSYAGESTELFLRSGKIKKMFCIDPWKSGYDISDEASSTDFTEVENNFDERTKGYNVVKMKMTMDEAVFLLPPLDVVYIDGNHLYDFVINDIKLSLTKIKKGGIISGHDFSTSDVCRSVNKMFGHPDEVFSDSSWLKKIN